jgi:GTP-binding protein SAR1
MLPADQDELIMGQIRFKTFDLGGHEGARKLWQEYYANVDGVVFLVDALDQQRFQEAKAELDALLTTENLQDVPFLVLGNKIDLPLAASEPQLRDALGLHDTTGKEVTERVDGQRPIEVFMCSVVRKMGYKDGFQWLAKFV